MQTPIKNSFPRETVEQLESLVTKIVGETGRKALSHVMLDHIEWSLNVILNRRRQAIDEVCEKALGNDPSCTLTNAQKAEIMQDIIATGQIFTSVKKLPQSIKEKIVQLAKVETGAERNARLLADTLGK